MIGQLLSCMQYFELQIVVGVLLMWGNEKLSIGANLITYIWNRPRLLPVFQQKIYNILHLLQVTLDFHDKDFVDLDFITSIAKCAQGFSAYYEYIPCGVIPTESPVPPPITKIFPVPPPTTNRPRLQCGGVVNAEIFNLSNEDRSQECVFIVEKFTEVSKYFVCKRYVL